MANKNIGFERAFTDNYDYYNVSYPTLLVNPSLKNYSIRREPVKGALNGVFCLFLKEDKIKTLSDNLIESKKMAKDILSKINNRTSSESRVTFNWQLTPVKLLPSGGEKLRISDNDLLDNGAANKICKEMDVKLRGIININNSDLSNDKSLFVRYVHNNKLGLCLFSSNDKVEINPIALIDDENTLNFSDYITMIEDNIDFRNGYTSLEEGLQPSKKQIFDLFLAAKHAFDVLDYPSDKSMFKALTKSTSGNFSVKEFYLEEDAFDYLRDMQIEGDNPAEQISTIEVVAVQESVFFKPIIKDTAVQGGVVNQENVAITKIVDMFYQSEQKHWEESNKPDDHIFYSLNYLKELIESRAGEVEKTETMGM